MPELPTITSQRLRSFEPGEELRVESTGDDNELKTRTTNWFQRFIRLISIPFRAPDKAQQYGDAKQAVFDALTIEYGKKIAESVFRANIGELDYGKTSPYDPITGRQIRRMVEQGDRAILEKYSKPENGGIDYSTIWPQITDKPLDTEVSTQEWMLRKSAGMPSPSLDDPPSFDRFDRRSMELRGHPLEIQPQKPDSPRIGHRLAETILRDYEAQRENAPLQEGRCWTLDLKKGSDDEEIYTIGVRIDPTDPTMVKVFDVNQCEVAIPRYDLGRWLDAHLRKHHIVHSCALHRAEETMTDPNYQKQDGQWRRRFEVDIDRETFSERFKDNLGLVRQSQTLLDNVAVHAAFKKDVDRLTVEVIGHDRSHVLRSTNFKNAFEDLLGSTGDWEQDTRARLNLSSLLNQNLDNTLNDSVNRKMLKEMNGEQFIPRDPCSRIVVSRTSNDMIRIDVDVLQRIKRINSPGNELSEVDELDPRSVVHSSYSLQIPRQALSQIGGLDRVEIVKAPHAEIDFMPFLGRGTDEEPQRLEIGLHVEGDHLVSEGLYWPTIRLPGQLAGCGTGKDTEVLDGVLLNSECVDNLQSKSLPQTIDWGSNLEPMVLDRHEMSLLGPFGLDGDGMTNLSHLLSPSTVRGVQTAMMREILQDDGFELDPGMLQPETRITPVTLPDNSKAIDIEIRCVMPEGMIENSKGTLVHSPSPLPPPGRFETGVKLRIPLEDLNGPMPGRFNLVYPCRLEWRPQQ